MKKDFQAAGEEYWIKTSALELSGSPVMVIAYFPAGNPSWFELPNSDSQKATCSVVPTGEVKVTDWPKNSL